MCDAVTLRATDTDTLPNDVESKTDPAVCNTSNQKPVISVHCNALWCAVMLWCCDAVMLWCCDAVRLWCCDAVMQWATDTLQKDVESETMWNRLSRLRHFLPKNQWYLLTVMLFDEMCCDAVMLWCCDALMLWYCDAVMLWEWCIAKQCNYCKEWNHVKPT